MVEGPSPLGLWLRAALLPLTFAAAAMVIDPSLASIPPSTVPLTVRVPPWGWYTAGQPVDFTVPLMVIVVSS